jgi:N-acyl-L-homoserine lactone synthetase
MRKIVTKRSTEQFREDRRGSTGLEHRIFAELKKWMVHLMQGQIQDEKEDQEKAVYLASSSTT